MTPPDRPTPRDASIDPGVHEILRRRWSPRAFQPRRVDSDVLRVLFEAARWAPSSANEQPWRFMVATSEDREAFDRLLGALTERNQIWARMAPVLMFTVAKTRFTQFDRENRHGWHDVGLATGNLLAQATALGVSAHVMAGYDADKARAAIQIPEGFEPVTAIAIGYEGDPSMLPDDFRERELAARDRKPAADLIFGGRWGQAF